MIDLYYESRYCHTAMVNPDFVSLAKAMKVHAIRCDNIADLPAKMKAFMEYDNSRPVLLECRVNKTEVRWCHPACRYAGGLENNQSLS
jgi:acetolactate synthase-1/2/3 large subunit